MKKYLSIIVGLLLLLPSGVFAETVLRVGDKISVDASQVIDGDYYVSVGPFGDTTMSGEITGDMYALGASLTVNGKVDQDLSILGGTAQIYAAVSDDVRVMAGEVTIADHVGGDVFVLGGVLNVLSTATIDGNVFFFGGDAIIEGMVAGSVFGTAQNIRIDGPIGANVDVRTSGSLVLGSKTNIAGSVTYSGVDTLERAPDAIIDGEVSSRAIVVPSEKRSARDLLVPIFITLFATLSLFLLFKPELVRLVENIEYSYTRASLVGLGTFFIGPFISLLLIVTILGSLVGIIALLLLFVLYFAAFALCGVVTGAVLSRYIIKQPTVSLPWILVGTLFLEVILFIPVIGLIIVIGIFLITLGGLVLSAYRQLT